MTDTTFTSLSQILEVNSGLKMSTLDATKAELGLVVLYLDKAEARDKICRSIKYGSKFLSNREPGTAQNVDISTTLAQKVFLLFKLLPSPPKSQGTMKKEVCLAQQASAPSK